MASPGRVDADAKRSIKIKANRFGKHKRAHLIIKTQFDNAGDALILREMIRLVSSHAETYVYLGRCPDYFSEQLELEALKSVRAIRAGGYVAACRDMIRARIIDRSDCFYFLTPGGMNGEKTPKQFALELVRLTVVALLSLTGVKVCQVGFSLERIGDRHAFLLRNRSRFLFACMPRDSISLNYARSLGIKVSGLAPDLSLNMPQTEAPNVEHRRKVCLSFRVDKDPKIRDQLRSITKAVAESIDHNTGLVFLAQVGRDESFMRELRDLASEKISDRVEFRDAHRSIREASAAYGECSVVISNRLHVLLLALNAGASPTALTVPELDTKILGVFEELGLANRVHDISDVCDADLLLAPMELPISIRKWAQQLESTFDDILVQDTR